MFLDHEWIDFKISAVWEKYVSVLDGLTYIQYILSYYQSCLRYSLGFGRFGVLSGLCYCTVWVTVHSGLWYFMGCGKSG